jgi:hypothetical protein
MLRTSVEVVRPQASITSFEMLAEQMKILDDASRVQAEALESAGLSIQDWVTSFPVEQIDEAIEKLEDKRREIDDHIALLMNARGMWKDLQQTANGNGNGHKPTKRHAVLALLSSDPDREFKLADIRLALVGQGVMADTDKAAHSLQMTLHNMFKRYGEVERPRPGHYRLARTGTKASDLIPPTGAGEGP